MATQKNGNEVRKNIYSIGVVLCVAALFASCGHERPPAPPPSGVEVEVEMKMIAATLHRMRSYVAEEDRINSLCLLVFDASAAAGEENNAVFLYRRDAWLSGASYRTTLRAGVRLNIYFAVNVKELLESAGLTEGDTFGEVRDKLLLAAPGDITYDNIPMWGHTLDCTIRESAANQNLGTIPLLRSVASADIVMGDNGFVFEKAYIVRATDKGFLSYKTDNVDASGLIVAPETPPGAIYTLGNDGLWFHAPTPNASGFASVENKFYLFENDAAAADAPVKHHTRLIVSGRYDNGTATYYPLAFRDANNEKVQTARNRKFEIYISNVNGRGYAALEEAIDAEEVNMQYEVIVWDDEYRDDNIIIHGSRFVSFPGGRTAVIAGQTGSGARIPFSTNALLWSGAAPENFHLSFDHFAGSVTGALIGNDRFSVQLLREAADPAEEAYYLLVTAKAEFNDTAAGAHNATLSIRIGQIGFDVLIRQVDHGWGDGGNQGVDL